MVSMLKIKEVLSRKIIIIGAHNCDIFFCYKDQIIGCDICIFVILCQTKVEETSILI